MTTGNKRLSQINHKKQQALEELSSLNFPETIKPKFKLNGLNHHKPLIRIQDASIAYEAFDVILEGIHFHLNGCERVALYGDNASGSPPLSKRFWGIVKLREQVNGLFLSAIQLGISISIINIWIVTKQFWI